MYKINPEWKKYNDLQNEGGEGYNPHKKYISANIGQKEISKTSPTANAGTIDRLLNDERGNLIRESKLRENLAKDLVRLQKLTDQYAIAIVAKSIAHAKNQLCIA